MSTVLDRPEVEGAPAAIRASHVVQGRLVEGDAVRHTSRDLGIDFTTPAIELEALVPPRSQPAPMADVPLRDVIDFLAATGERMHLDRNEHLQRAVELTAATNVLPMHILRNLVDDARAYLTKDTLLRIVESNFDPAYLDGWVEQTDNLGQKSHVRAYPPRLIHMMAGNSPMAAVASIAQGARVKAVNLFKMPSSDPFTTVAVLRTMADIDPDHPVVRSMSAVYWRGGDESIERMLYRPQYFDKVVAWGGGSAIENVAKYIGPGFQMVSFDPKSSISMIGAESFADEATMDEVAERAAIDVSVLDQEACLSSRFIFAEGNIEQIDAFCGKLASRLGVERSHSSAKVAPLPMELREEIEVMQLMDNGYRVWGSPDGSGLVIRSNEPVEFHPSNKTANVVQVPSLADALRYVNVATQTVGVYPDARKPELRDGLASRGAQRVVRLGSAGQYCVGAPHDAMYPLHRFVHWMVDEEA